MTSLFRKGSYICSYNFRDFSGANHGCSGKTWGHLELKRPPQTIQVWGEGVHTESIPAEIAANFA